VDDAACVGVAGLSGSNPAKFYPWRKRRDRDEPATIKSSSATYRALTLGSPLSARLSAIRRGH
jgi:hypothetical protein